MLDIWIRYGRPRIWLVSALGILLVAVVVTATLGPNYPQPAAFVGAVAALAATWCGFRHFRDAPRTGLTLAVRPARGQLFVHTDSVEICRRLSPNPFKWIGPASSAVDDNGSNENRVTSLDGFSPAGWRNVLRSPRHRVALVPDVLADPVDGDAANLARMSAIETFRQGTPTRTLTRPDVVCFERKDGARRARQIARRRTIVVDLDAATSGLIAIALVAPPWLTVLREWLQAHGSRDLGGAGLYAVTQRSLRGERFDGLDRAFDGAIPIGLIGAEGTQIPPAPHTVVSARDQILLCSKTFSKASLRKVDRALSERDVDRDFGREFDPAPAPSTATNGRPHAELRITVIGDRSRAESVHNATRDAAGSRVRTRWIPFGVDRDAEAQHSAEYPPDFEPLDADPGNLAAWFEALDAESPDAIVYAPRRSHPPRDVTLATDLQQWARARGIIAISAIDAAIATAPNGLAATISPLGLVLEALEAERSGKEALAILEMLSSLDRVRFQISSHGVGDGRQPFDGVRRWGIERGVSVVGFADAHGVQIAPSPELVVPRSAQLLELSFRSPIDRNGRS